MRKSRFSSRFINFAATCALITSCLMVGGVMMAQSEIPFSPATTNGTDRRVGELGDPKRLDFEGLRAFSAEAVRQGLQNDMDYQLDAHASASLDDYLSTVCDRVSCGYLHAGFPDVQAIASLDSRSGRILVKVDEGPRCQQAGIKMSGARTIPVDRLVRRLLELPPSANPTNQFNSRSPQDCTGMGLRGSPYGDSSRASGAAPIWERGKPAPFDESTLNSLTRNIEDALQDLGRFCFQVKVKVVPNRDQGTADLLIELLDEGAPGVIDQINITGLKRNSRAELLEYLQLKPGMPVNRDLLKQVEELLWRSGRFLAFAVTPEIVPDRHRLNLQITLTECRQMPRLHENLSREAAGLLHFRDWLSDQPSSGNDLVVTLGGTEDTLPLLRSHSGQIIMSKKGLLLLARDGTTNENLPVLYAASLAPEMVGLFDLKQHTKLAFALTNAPVKLKASIEIDPNPDPDATNHFALTAAAGFEMGDAYTSAAPFRIDSTLAPIAFASYPYLDKQDAVFAFSNGLMSVTAKGYHLITEEGSGKLVALDGEGAAFHVSSQSHGFDQALAQILQASAIDRNQADAKTPINSLLSWLLYECVQTESPISWLGTNLPAADRRRVAAVWAKILNHGIFAPLDDMVARQRTPPGVEPFSIPTEVTPASQTSEFAKNLVAVVFRYANDLFPHDSWPWLVLRETALSLDNKAKYRNDILQSICESDRTGPLGFESIAALFGLVSSQAQAFYANKGLTRLANSDFQHDYELLLGEDCALRLCFAHFVQELAGLDAGELESLAAELPPGSAAALRMSVNSLRQSPSQPLAATLAPALKALWDNGLKQVVESDLQKRARFPVQSMEAAQKWQGEIRINAEKGNPQAQCLLGKEFASGDHGLPQDYQAAVKWYRRAAEQNNADAQNNLGDCFFNGQGVKTNYAEAVKWYRRAAEQNNLWAQNSLGACYFNGQGVEINYAEAVKWYRQAAEHNNIWAQNNLGWCLAHGQGAPQDEVAAATWYRRAAEQDNADAQNNLGACYFNGQGVKTNYAKAVRWHRQAAEQGNVTGQIYLGWAYESGNGVTQDYKTAVAWYRRAAEQGDADAEDRLGRMYRGSRGIETNFIEAINWYRKAAEQGNADAQVNLGLMYERGNGLPKGLVEAAKWYRKAATQGDAWGENNLGVLYEHGYGVPANYAEAVKWYRQAAQQDNVNALENLAWILATCPDAQQRDGGSAIQFAQRAVALSDQNDPDAPDTLAAAYAEAGQFTNAVTAEIGALKIVKEEKAKADFNARLELYKSNKPFRDLK